MTPYAIQNKGDLIAVSDGASLYRVMTQVGYYWHNKQLVNEPKPKWFLVVGTKTAKVPATKGKKWTEWRNSLKVQRVVNQELYEQYCAW